MTTTIPTTTTAVYATGPGELTSVLRIGQVPLPPLGPTDVLVRFIAASVNPSDTAAIRGVYPTPLGPVPAGTTIDGNPVRGVPGFEGLAEVIALGSDAATTTHGVLASPNDASPYLAVGDWVIPAVASLGTWRHEAVVPVASVLRVPKLLTPAAAATLVVNPTTALRMLTDYVTLAKGDVVVQNAGNSAVGQYVAQISRARGYVCVSVVRDRADFDATATKLKDQGAAHVVRPADLAALVAAHPEWKVRLAFNAVGPADELIAALGVSGTLVTYGVMSPVPLTVNPGLFVVKDLTLKGFWMTAWKTRAAPSAYRTMIDELVGMYASGALQTPDHDQILVPRTGAVEADVIKGIVTAGQGFAGRKQLLVFQ